MVPAFTLAEVLITLGIIGVVAAITFPTLINKYQKAVTTTKLKKIYSVMANATLRAENDFGPSKYWDFPIVIDGSYGTISVEDFFDRYYAPYMNMSKEVDNKLGKYIITNYNGAVTFMYNSSYDIHVRSVEGICLRFWANNQFVVLNADLNCEAPPNVIGKDVFDIAEFVENRKFTVPRLWSIKDEKTRQDAIASCKNFSAINGLPSLCFAVFVYDGWKFKDDYPW